MKLNSELINGIGKTGDNFVIILNVDKVLSEEDLSFAAQTADETAEVQGMAHE
jgi:chemotaxis signal transduction protein